MCFYFNKFLVKNFNTFPSSVVYTEGHGFYVFPVFNFAAGKQIPLFVNVWWTLRTWTSFLSVMLWYNPSSSPTVNSMFVSKFFWDSVSHADAISCLLRRCLLHIHPTYISYILCNKEADFKIALVNIFHSYFLWGLKEVLSFLRHIMKRQWWTSV